MHLSSHVSSLALSVSAIVVMIGCGPSAAADDAGAPPDGMIQDGEVQDSGVPDANSGRCLTNADCTGTAERCFFTELMTLTPIFECGGLGYCAECSGHLPGAADAGAMSTVCDCSGHTVVVPTEGYCYEQPYAHRGPC